jgi:DNA-binding beta-propeller fold protein YncE
VDNTFTCTCAAVYAGATCTVYVPALVFAATPAYTTTIGAGGLPSSAVDRFAYPFGLAFSSVTGFLHVTERDNNRLQVFSPNFTHARTVGVNAGLDLPHGIAVSTTGIVYVPDSNNNRVLFFYPDGTLKGTLTGLNYPCGVATSTQTGYIYVADTNNNRIKVFNEASGKLLQTLGASSGLNRPYGIAVSRRTGLIYIADTHNHVIHVWDEHGNAVLTLGQMSVAGNSNNQFRNPTAIAVSPLTGHVAVVDEYNHRIQVFDKNGVYTTTIGTTSTPGNSASHFNYPTGATFSLDGRHLLVTDGDNNRVQVFDVLQCAPGYLGDDCATSTSTLMSTESSPATSTVFETTTDTSISPTSAIATTESSTLTSTLTTTSTSTLTSTSAITVPTADLAPSSSSSSSSMGIIVGAVVGSFIFLAFLLFLLIRRQTSRRNAEHRRRQVSFPKVQMPRGENDGGAHETYYQNVNTGRDGYETPHNLQRLMEAGADDTLYSVPTESVASATEKAADSYSFGDDTLYSVPTESVVAVSAKKSDPYYSLIPSDVAKYMNMNGGEAPPHHWNIETYTTGQSNGGESDPYTEISLDGEEDFYSHTMHGFGGEVMEEENTTI